MKKKIAWFLGIAFMIIAAGAFILLQPYIKTASALGKVIKADSIEFHAGIRLDADTLSENEKDFVDILEWIFQVEEEDIFNLYFTGEKNKRDMAVTVYCNAAEYPLTEVYYGEDQRTVNLKMFYEAIEKSLPDKLWLLKTLLPEWGMEEETVSFEQLEKLGINPGILFPFETGRDLETPSILECIYLLSKLEKEEDEKGNIWFWVEHEEYSIRFCARETEDGAVVFLKGEATGENQKIENFEADISAGL